MGTSKGHWLVLLHMITLSGPARMIILSVRVASFLRPYASGVLSSKPSWTMSVGGPPRWWSEKLFPPRLSEMEQSAGWSRLVCSRQWRVKEITAGLCQQPWPCSREHNEGGHAWPAGEKEGGSSWSIFHGRQTDCCMLFYKPRSMSMTEAFQRAAGCGSLGWKHTPLLYWK